MAQRSIAAPALPNGGGSADRLARAVSIVCSPPMLVLPLAGLIGQRAAGHPAAWPGVVALLLATAVLPSLFIAAAYRAGHVRTFDLTDRAERVVPSAFTAICAATVYPILVRIDAPAILLTTSTALAAQLAVLAAVTTRWKISYHAATAAGLASFAWAVEGASVGLPLFALAAVVGWARIRLGRHTPTQVAAGLLTGAPVLWWAWLA